MNPTTHVTVNINQGPSTGETLNSNEKPLSSEMDAYLSVKDLSGNYEALTKDLNLLKDKTRGKEGITPEEVEKGLIALVVLESKRTDQFLTKKLGEMSDIDSILLNDESYIRGLENKPFNPSNPNTAIEMTKDENGMKYLTISDTNLADMPGAAELIPIVSGKSQKEIMDMLKDKTEIYIPIGKTGAKLLIKRDHLSRNGSFSTTMKIVAPLHNTAGDAGASGYNMIHIGILNAKKAREEKNRVIKTTPFSIN